MDEIKKSEKPADDFVFTVTKIPPGQSRQHFINVPQKSEPKGALYKQQLIGDEWKLPEEKK
jgi:hypothetical protein